MLALALTLLSPPAAAALTDAELSLETSSLAVGLAPDGSLICRACGLGLLWDPDGAEGTLPAGGDWLLARRPFEIWSMSAQVDGESRDWVNADAEGSALPMEWSRAADGPDALALYGEGGDEVLAVEQWVVLYPGADLVGLLSRVTARAPLTDLRLARVADPDPDYGFNGDTDTLNVGGDGVASAAGAWDGRALALASAGGVGAICGWCTRPDELLSGSAGPETGDDQIGVTVSLGDLAAGESVTVAFVYALATDADQARAAAIDAAAALSEDLDGDGLSAAEGDCDEGRADASPGASQQWNGEDDDCDGAIDEDSVGSDDDGDGLSEAEGDCDDADPSVYPGAPSSGGPTDADCDGQPDDGVWGELPEGAEKAGGCDSAGGLGGGPPSSLALAWLAGAAALLGRRR